VWRKCTRRSSTEAGPTSCFSLQKRTCTVHFGHENILRTRLSGLRVVVLHLARHDLPCLAVPSMRVAAVGTGTVAMPNFVLTRRAAVESGEARGSGTLLALGRPERVPFTERGHGAFTAMARTVPLYESVIVMIDLPGAGAQGRGGGLKSSWVLARSRTRRRSREKSRVHHTGRDGTRATCATTKLCSPSGRPIAECSDERERRSVEVQLLLLLSEMILGRGRSP